MTYGLLAHAGAGAGSDKAKLGRWTWAWYQVKQGTFLWCISLYRPCPCNQGAETSAAQQHQYFRSINDDHNPHSAFLEDFKMELQEWLALGDHIIVGGDTNQPILHLDIQALFNRLHMINALSQQHDLQTAPATFVYRQDTIDGLWVTQGISVTQCGFLATGKQVPGDHSLVWMDVPYELTFCHIPILPQTFQARRLRLYNTKQCDGTWTITSIFGMLRVFRIVLPAYARLSPRATLYRFNRLPKLMPSMLCAPRQC